MASARTRTVTALHPVPTDVEAFEAHYLSTHVPLVDAIPGLARRETTRPLATPDGSPPPHHRSATLSSADTASLQAGPASPEGRATAQDATGLSARTGCRVTLVLGQLD